MTNKQLANEIYYRDDSIRDRIMSAVSTEPDELAIPAVLADLLSLADSDNMLEGLSESDQDEVFEELWGMVYEGRN
jgi:hypothetical protein